MVQHTEILHTEEKHKQYKCKDCFKSYTTSEKLTIHQRVHTGERPYQCYECNQAFSSKGCLMRHLAIIHTSEKSFECKDCHKLFTTKSNLTKHLRIHTGEKPYHCSHCDKEFSQSSTLKVHMRIHTGEKPFKCSYCEKSFSLKFYLASHMKTHIKNYESRDNTTQIKDSGTDTELDEVIKDATINSTEEEKEFSSSTGPALNFKCTECDYKCVTKFLLVRHTRKHTGEKPFSCPECDYKSAYQSNLDAHIKKLHHWLDKNKNKKGRHKKKYTSEKSYDCPDCPYKSAHKKNLVSHIKNHHQWTEPINRQTNKTEPTLKKYPLRNKYSCTECNTKFHSKDGLENHMLTHFEFLPPDEVNGTVFSDEHPSVQFPDKDEHSHENNDLEDDGYECSMCDFICSSEKDIQEHSLVCKHM